MDLVALVTDKLGVERPQAEAGLGAVFFAIRMAMDAAAFETVKAALPDVLQWMAAGPKGGRTGEMLSFVGPQALQKRLAAAEFDEAQRYAFIALVRNALTERFPVDKAPKIAAGIARALPS